MMSNMKCKIDLHSRGGTANSYLIEIEDDKYEWIPSDDTYDRISEREGEVIFLDPDGGPMICKGAIVGQRL